MIHNLEVERRRIDEALEVLRRLHKIRKPSSDSGAGEEYTEIQPEERDDTEIRVRRESS
jgi:hypothetical protein